MKSKAQDPLNKRRNLINTKERWLEKLRHTRVKLSKARIKDPKIRKKTNLMTMKVDFIELSKIPICNLIKASNCKIVPVAAYVMCATYESKVDRRRTR